MNYDTMTADELEAQVNKVLKDTDITDPKEQINYIMRVNEPLGIAYTESIATGE